MNGTISNLDKRLNWGSTLRPLGTKPLGFESPIDCLEENGELLAHVFWRKTHRYIGKQAPVFHPRIARKSNRKPPGIGITDGVRPSVISRLPFTHFGAPGIWITDECCEITSQGDERPLGFQSQMPEDAPAFESPMTWETHHGTNGIQITDVGVTHGISSTVFGAGP